MADPPNPKEDPADRFALPTDEVSPQAGPVAVGAPRGVPLEPPLTALASELLEALESGGTAPGASEGGEPTSPRRKKRERPRRPARYGTAVAMPSILVVDDDEDVCEFLSVFLIQEGYRVRTISDPTRVLEMLHEEQFHICILDLMMPKLSGMDLLGQIRRIDDDLAVVVHTGYPSLESATGSIHHAVSDYLKKPVDTEQFRAVLQRIAKKKGLAVRREDELHRAIGRRIRELRKQHGLTLKQLARRTGLSVSLLSQLERAESASSVSSLFKVASALETRIADLLGDF